MRMSINPTYEGSGAGSIFRFLCCFVLILVAISVVINIKVRPFIVSVAEGYAVNVVSNTLNEIMDDAMKQGDYNFINIIKDGEGKVAAATMNAADVNLLITKIAIGLKNKIADMDTIEAKIPLGNFVPYPFFSGLGPDIPVRFVILSNTSICAEEKFGEQGINQSLYTVSLNVETVVGIYIPTIHCSVTTCNRVPVSRVLIVGNVPGSYTNVEGLEGTAQDAVMNID